MALNLFPNAEQILDILLGEIPPGVFAEDRADSPDESQRSYSSSELRVWSQQIADLYENLQKVENNKFIVTADVIGLTQWEKELFSTAQDSNQSVTDRRQNLLAKLRSSGGISLEAILSVIHGILDPVGLPFELLTWCGSSNGAVTGAWILDVSALGLDTYLGTLDPLNGTGLGLGLTPLDCRLDYVAAGLTLDEMIEIQETAYMYEIDIYGNADAATLALLDRQLTALEPARSSHIIRNNVTPPSI